MSLHRPLIEALLSALLGRAVWVFPAQRWRIVVGPRNAKTGGRVLHVGPFFITLRGRDA